MLNTQIIRARWVITDADSPALTDGAVVVESEAIREVGDWSELRKRYPKAQVLGSEGHAVMPGLINAHHHSFGVPLSLQGVADDLLEPWMLNLKAMRQQDSQLRTLFSAAQLLRSGVTATIDMTTARGSAERSNRFLRSQLEAYERAGLRVALAPGTTYSSFLISGRGEDEAFLNSLPAGLADRVRETIPLSESLDPDDYMGLIEDLHTAYKTHPRLEIWFGPPGPQWVDDALMQRIAERAADLGMGIQTHGLESFYEKLEGPRSTGKRTVVHLRDLGVLGPRFSIAHGVWLTKEEIEILAETGAGVSHNPSSNLRLRTGVAPLNMLLQAGVTTGLGMDGTTINDDGDMLQEMRLALRLHRTPHLGAPAPAIRDIFRIATQGGARLIGHEQTLGRIAPGYKADLVLVNLKNVTWPWIAPEADPLDIVVMRAKGGDVDTVLVSGEIVLQDGMPTGFDIEAVGAELAAGLTTAPVRSDLQAVLDELKPHLINWYRAWDVPALDPYEAFNSRI